MDSMPPAPTPAPTAAPPRPATAKITPERRRGRGPSAAGRASTGLAPTPSMMCRPPRRRLSRARSFPRLLRLQQLLQLENLLLRQLGLRAEMFHQIARGPAKHPLQKRLAL